MEKEIGNMDVLFSFVFMIVMLGFVLSSLLFVKAQIKVSKEGIVYEPDEATSMKHCKNKCLCKNYVSWKNFTGTHIFMNWSEDCHYR